MKVAIGGLLIVITVIIFLSIILYSPITKDYSINNTYWNGLSKLIEKLHDDKFHVIIHKKPLYTLEINTTNSCIFIISPELNYSEREILFLQEFVDKDGIVFLLDDFGLGNQILEKLKVPVHFIGKPLLDEIIYSKQPFFPLIVGLKNEVYLPNMTLVLNIPTALRIEKVTSPWSIVPMAFSSSSSFIDFNLNSKRDPNEVKRPYPVMIAVKRGKGKLIIISDSSILINCMIDEYDNYPIFRILLKKYNIKRVVIDYAHYKKTTLEDLKGKVITHLSLIQNLLKDPLISYTLNILTIVLIMITVHKLVKRCKREYI